MDGILKRDGLVREYDFCLLGTRAEQPFKKKFSDVIVSTFRTINLETCVGTAFIEVITAICHYRW